MIKNNLNFFNNIQKKNLDSKSIKKFTKLFPKILSKVFTDINSSKKTLNTLNKKFNFNFEFKDLEKFKSFKTIAIIGMGGSILGSEAVSHFLKEKIKKKIYFFNDLNIKKIQNFKKKKNLDKVLFFVISKSGNTVETLSNFFILKIIKKNSKNIIIISEKKNNLLYSLSKKFNLFYIEHKNYIGGRYSVLSEVGIVPAYLMGININKLRSGSLKSLKKKTQLFLKDSTIMLSSLLSFKKINNLIFLNYCPELEKFLFWCQQLIAESLGKKGKGFLPTISNVPKDHHSLLQLYLDGPKNKLFYIFSNEESSKEKINIKEILKEKNFLNNKTLNSIKKAQKNALIKTLKNKNIPFREFKIKNINEEVLGELFSYFILETVIIGKLTNINPFDQPAVEQVKIYTKDLLN
ncbi:glucose-6-phosphate isomerase [Candidatus Pelagibacter bacterium]|nr:glucose-6-phosphate isomerase [Candidatus Pelagibacter bacterium]